MRVGYARARCERAQWLQGDKIPEVNGNDLAAAVSAITSNKLGGQACKPDFVQRTDFSFGAPWRSFL